MIRRARTRLLVVPLVCASLLLGCEDDRGEPTAPDTGNFDAGDIFGVSQVSMSVLGLINGFAETIVDLHDSGTTLPVQIPGCSGDGRATITTNGDSDPNTYRVIFGTSDGSQQFAIGCDSGLTLRFTQQMIFTLIETSPGLRYEVEMPFNPVTGAAEGITLLLPADAGGLLLQITTPGGPLDYRLEGPRADSRHAGFVHLSGTLRLEDRLAPLLVMEELRLEYNYNDDVIPKYAAWPSGSFEVATNGQSGVPGAGGVPGFPVEVFLDGFGGAVFEVGDTVCEVNLATGDNPCEDL